MTATMTTYDLARKQAEARTAEQDNSLVAQKDEILRRINAAEYADGLNDVLSLLNFVAPLWEAVGYGDKVREVKQRIKDRAQYQATENEILLMGERKNSKTRRFAENQIEQLNAIAASL